MDKSVIDKLIKAQKNEITEYYIYNKLAGSIKEKNNNKVLIDISRDELKHYNSWKKYTKLDVEPSRFKIWKYYWLSKLFGITFGIKLMEKGEQKAQINYASLSKFIPEAKKIEKDEDEHEKQLIALLDEERLKYVGSIVLGLNDALVELTGALAGFTLALRNTSIIAMTGLITGIAAALSMAVSEYLSTKTEGELKNPIKASVYTGITYIVTVLFLILPFLTVKNVFFALGFTMLNAIIVIFLFTYYISVAKDLSFRKRFFEMALISLSVAALTFGIGYLVRIFFQVDI